VATRADIDELRAAIRGRQLRATPSRVAVLALLRGEGQPLSHADVAERLAAQGWDRATIYRNLTDLAEAGLLARADLGDHVWRFEAVAGGHAQARHPHFVCTECGSVACLPGLEISLGAARGAPRAVRQRQVEVQVKGVCDACA
jgi:Fur family transcriptional regulator, ferric uptake regulator